MQGGGGGPGGEPALVGRLQTVLLASAGLFGVQVVWGLQNISTSRIFQTLGADVAELPILWIAAPLTGLLVQPVVGHFSDRSRSRFGRRRPFIAIGALLTSLGMLALGFAQTLAAAVVGLMGADGLGERRRCSPCAHCSPTSFPPTGAPPASPSRSS